MMKSQTQPIAGYFTVSDDRSRVWVSLFPVRPSFLGANHMFKALGTFEGAEFNSNNISVSLSDQATIAYSAFEQNYAPKGYGGALAGGSTSRTTVQSCRLSDNSAERGGGLAFKADAEGIVINMTAINNTASISGGAVNSATNSTVS